MPSRNLDAPRPCHRSIDRGASRAALAGAGSGSSSIVVLATILDAAPARAARLGDIQTIVVIYAENRSFDNLYGLFPGADGVANASGAPPQVDRDGSVLPLLPKIWSDKSAPAPPIFSGKLANGPFRVDQAPLDWSLEQKTRDLVHSFYQNQEQIDGGRNDRFAEVSNAGGIAMGYYDGSRLPMWRWASAFVLADHFFQGAFGGSFLNHQFLICACAPEYSDAPKEIRARLDANGWLERKKPESPNSALDGPCGCLTEP